MHHEGLDLSLEDLHAGCGDNRADVGDYDLTENVADEAVVPLEASSCWVFYWKTIIIVWRERKPQIPLRSHHTSQKQQAITQSGIDTSASALGFICHKSTHRQDLQQVGCSCMALLCPCDSASACSPLPWQPRPGSWRSHKPSKLASCDTLSTSRCTRSASKIDKKLVNIHAVQYVDDTLRLPSHCRQKSFHLRFLPPCDLHPIILRPSGLVSLFPGVSRVF